VGAGRQSSRLLAVQRKDQLAKPLSRTSCQSPHPMTFSIVSRVSRVSSVADCAASDSPCA
jgi:hypothetical protein